MNGKGFVNSVGNTVKKRRGPGNPSKLKPWPKGVSGNPKGAPKRGESWAEIIKRVGEMTPAEAAERSVELAKQFLSIGDGVTLKEAVVLRVYGALLFEPQAGLLNTFMERAEGKVSLPVSVETWRDKVIILLKEKKIEPQEVIKELGNDLATELFAAAGVAISESREAGTSGTQESQ